MNWLRRNPQAKAMQIAVFIEQAKQKLARAKDKVQGFDGSDWRIALWIMDILHQGRGNFAHLSKASTKPNPKEAPKRIGAPEYQNRINAVSDGVGRLQASGVLHGFTV